jgi:hypothetical protein
MPNWKKVIVSGSSAHLNQITGSGGIKLPDGVRINLGDANDLQIYHGGSNSVIKDAGTGGLILRATELKLIGDNTSEEFLVATENAGVEIYYDDSKKLETVNTGVNVTGAITGSGFVIGGHRVSDIDISGEFNDVDDHVMTSAAVQDKILGYSYSTTTGTVTSVATSGTVNGLTLTGGAITSTGTVTLGGTLAINNSDWSGADLSVANGGTGASTFTDGGILFGNGTDAIQASAVLAAGEILIGDGTTEPTILDVGSASGIEILGTIGTGVWQGTEIGLGYGGTELVGETDGKIVVADGSGAPVHLDIGSSSGITILGTIATGTWQGSSISTTYTDAKVTSVSAGGGIDVDTTTGAVTVSAEDASTTNPGVVELATTAETTTGTDAGRAVTPDGLKDGYQGSTNVATLGTIGTGTWEATDVAVAHGGTGASTLTQNGVLIGNGTSAVTAVDLSTDGAIVVGDGSGNPTSLDIGSSSGITILGTIATGVWEGTTIAVDQGGTGVTTMTALKNALDDETWTFANAVNIDATTSSTNKTSGALIVDGGVGVAENIHAGGDVVAYASSDERLKDNIEVIESSLDKVGEIRGITFNWNEDSPEWAKERGRDVGVIAQEVQKVLPEIVVERTNGYLGVDYKRLIPLLIESIKELKQEVEDLKKKVN